MRSSRTILSTTRAITVPMANSLAPLPRINVDVAILGVFPYRLLQRLFFKAFLHKVPFEGYPADGHGGPQEHRAKSVLSNDDGRHAFRGHVQALG